LITGFNIQGSAVLGSGVKDLLDSCSLFQELNWLAYTAPIKQIKTIKPIKHM